MTAGGGSASALAQLAAGHRLSDAQRGQLGALIEAIEGDPWAPTAIHGSRQVTERHLADSLAGLEIAAVMRARTVADLGSGVGLPGIALAIALPRARVSLVEAQRRRCEFLERACGRAGVENATPVWSRAEEWSEGMAANDVVVARALGPQPVVLEYAAPLLRVGGTLVDWRGARLAEEESSAERAAAVLGLQRESVERVAPFAGARSLHLHVFTKVRDTPSRFPRRAGSARKRPLGSP